MAHFGAFFWDADVKNGGIASKLRMQHSEDFCLLCVFSLEQKGAKLSSAGDSQDIWTVQKPSTWVCGLVVHACMQSS